VDNLEIHPLALAFPAYGEEDLAKLAGDIRDHGMRLAIKLFEGRVLDGRNRVDEARKAGLSNVPSKNFEGTYDEARCCLAEHDPPPSRYRAAGHDRG
jgi:hypothetical protein